MLKFLIDTGASKSYLRPDLNIAPPVPVKTPFVVKSIHGFNNINYKSFLNIFGVTTPFFHVPGLTTFDGIIEFDQLSQVNATLDLKDNLIRFNGGSEPLKFIRCAQVNFAKVDDIEVPPNVRESFLQMMSTGLKAFADPSRKLPFNTNVVATMRTENDEPVYSKMFPFPMGAADFVNQEIEEVLSHGIIRPSRSPYNNPIWVVGEKGSKT